MFLPENGRPLCCARSLIENGGAASIELPVAARDTSFSQLNVVVLFYKTSDRFGF